MTLDIRTWAFWLGMYSEIYNRMSVKERKRYALYY